MKGGVVAFLQGAYCCRTEPINTSPVWGMLSTLYEGETASMNREQRAAALKLLAALNGDAHAEQSTVTYGDWLQHLTAQVEDELNED